ncbi:MAG: hypothetical protein K8R88_10290 [Armatimonadetes bacterium]|nr:hypothetical protein [Armatimonadota bacterium]
MWRDKVSAGNAVVASIIAVIITAVAMLGVFVVGYGINFNPNLPVQTKHIVDYCGTAAAIVVPIGAIFMARKSVAPPES